MGIQLNKSFLKVNFAFQYIPYASDSGI